MQIADPESEMVGVPGDSAGLLLALEDRHLADAEAA